MADKISILIVDDEPHIRVTIQEFLSEIDQFNVIDAVPNGKQAIESCKRRVPDLILMDVNMPVMGGLDATRMIHTMFPRVVILMLSTETDMEIIRTAISGGARDYVSKPIRGNLLVDKILSLFNRPDTTTSSQQPGKARRDRRLIAFFGIRAGMGTTTIACNLGSILAQKHSARILMIDADSTYADLSHYLGRRREPTIVDLLRQGDPSKADVIGNYIMQTKAGVDLLPGSPIGQIESLDESKVMEIARSIAGNYDRVILDFPGLGSALRLEILKQVETLFLVISNEVVAVRLARILIEILKRRDFPMKTLKVVYNLIAPLFAGVESDQVEDILTHPLFAMVAGNPEVVTTSYLQQIPFSHTPPTSVGKSIEQLADRLAENLRG